MGSLPVQKRKLRSRPVPRKSHEDLNANGESNTIADTDKRLFVHLDNEAGAQKHTMANDNVGGRSSRVEDNVVGQGMARLGEDFGSVGVKVGAEQVQAQRIEEAQARSFVQAEAPPNEEYALEDYYYEDNGYVENDDDDYSMAVQPVDGLYGHDDFENGNYIEDVYGVDSLKEHSGSLRDAKNHLDEMLME